MSLLLLIKSIFVFRFESCGFKSLKQNNFFINWVSRLKLCKDLCMLY